MIVLANDCMPPKTELWKMPAVGEQHYDWGYHGGRKHSQHSIHTEAAPHFYLDDEDSRQDYFRMVEEIVTRYKDDERICIWDIYNEPSNSRRRGLTLPNLKEMFRIVREINPSQPLTTCVWRSKGYYLLAKLEALRGKKDQAVAFLNESLRTNADHLLATCIAGVLTGNDTVCDTVMKKDPLFFAGLHQEKNAIHLAIELTQHHAWLYFLSALELLKKGDSAAAKKALLDGLVFPENYGEEKNYFANDAPIYLELYKPDQDAKYLNLAISTKGAPTVHSYYQCLALEQLGRKEDAMALAERLQTIGENKIRNAAANDYYGVGAPAYPPFGYDIVNAHTTDGLILCAFAALAKQDTDTAKDLARQIEKLESCHFFLCLLRSIFGDI